MLIKRVMSVSDALALSRRVKANLDEIEFVQRDDKNKKSIYQSSDTQQVENAISANGEYSKFKILERKYVEKWFPEIPELYETIRAEAEEYFGEKVITSPFYRSSINMNVYDGEGTCHAAHVDSNPIANILCLSEGAPLQIFKNEEWVDVSLYPGEVVILPGKDLMHRVSVGDEDNFRVVISFTLYFPHDCSRPDGLDRIAYGEG